MAETNVEMARRGYEAALRGNLDVIRDFLEPAALVANLTTFATARSSRWSTTPTPTTR